MSKSIAQHSRRRLIGGQAPLWVFIVLILLSGLVGTSAVLLSHNSSTLIFDCISHSCPTSLAKKLQVDSKALVQDFDFEIGLQKLPNAPEGTLSNPLQMTGNGANQVALFSAGRQRLLVRIPTRYGTDPSFDYYSPPVHALHSVRVRVVQGREMFIYINGKIAYTHRYQLPVFYSNPINLIQATVPDSGYLSTVTVTKSKVYRESVNVERFSNLLFVLFGVLLSGFLCLLLLKALEFPATNSVKLRTAPFRWMKGLWLACLIAWIMSPFDPTGATNPGLFPPLGPAFSDYFQVSQASHFNQPYIFMSTDYPPFALAILKGLTFLLPGFLGMAVIIAMCLGVLSFMYVQVNRTSTGTSRFKNILIFILPYPLVFGIIRGNIDLLAAALLWLAILLKDSKYAIWPALLLASAISLKFWPVVFIFFFLRWGNRKLAFLSIGLATALTVVSPFVLGYRNLSAAFHAVLPSLSASNLLTGDALHNTFSLSSLMYFGHILLLSANPFRSTPHDLANALAFAGSPLAKLIFIAIGIFLVRMMWKTKTVSSSYLFCSGLALLISTPTYTYRGVILVVYFYLVWREISSSGEKQLDETGLMARLEGVRQFAWLPILAPTTILFIKNTQISAASVLQPMALVVLLLIEVYLSNREVDA